MAGLDSAETVYPTHGFPNLADLTNLQEGEAVRPGGSQGSPIPIPSPQDLPDPPLPHADGEGHPLAPPPQSPTLTAPHPLPHRTAPNVPAIITNGPNIIASIIPTGSKPLDSYARDFLLKLHPSVFPNGKGARPQNMSPIQYYRILLERVPTAQYGHNVGLLFDMFDQWQRHAVNTQANVIIKGSPHIVGQLSNLTQRDVESALEVVGKSGSSLLKAKSSLSPKARTFLGLLRRLGSRIPGSPQAKLRLRSMALALPLVYGSATIMCNLCISESAAYLVFDIGSPNASYRFNIFTGEPDSRRLPKMEALR